MSAQSLITIVLPVYNGSRYLARSVESCLNQTYRNIELIIVNDCSTDDTLAIAEQYALQDERVRIIDNAVNQRLPKSLNIGFAASCGELLTWTSDDNFYKENAFEVMVEYLNKDSDAGFVYADMWQIDENDTIIEYGRNLWFNGDVSNLPIVNNVGACFLYRRCVYDAVGDYDAAEELVEDWDYWCRIWAGFKVLHIPRGLYYYRQHSASLTGTRFEEQRRMAIRFVKRNLERYVCKVPDDIKMRAYLKCANDARGIDDRQLAQECYRLAISISPEAKEYTSKELSEYAGI